MKRSQRLKIVFIKTKFKVTGLFSKQKAAEQLFTVFCTPYGTTQRSGEPKEAEALAFTLNGKKIRGHRWNHPQPKKALILHGFSSAAYKFDRYVSPLVKKGYEVLSFDAPAHGSSGGSTVNAVEYAAMVKKVIELYGPVQSFIAHSFGGIAITLTLESMAHDAGHKLVLIAPATETTSAIESAFTMFGIEDAGVRQAFNRIIEQKGGHGPEWFSIRRAVKNIRAKILWLHDEEDDMTPLSDALKVKEDNHPNIQFVITKGLGHRRIYHDAGVKKAIVDFL
ncbi:MAG: alpha/beta fold hydrolase [Ferruginibacter sp.]